MRQEGARAVRFLREAPQPQANARPSGTTPAPEAPLDLGIDGGMVFVEGRWQEVKLGCVYDARARVEVSRERVELSARQVVAGRGDPAALGQLLWPRARAAGAEWRPLVVLGDGAPWIWNLAAEYFPRQVEILDWYHADEHVSATARILYGEGSEKAAAWRDAQLTRLWEGQVDDVITGLRFLGAHQRSMAKRRAAEELGGYLTRNRERMQYDRYREADYPIGSGAVESAVSHTVQQRMKRVGMRWGAAGADAMLALRSVYRSTGTWDQFWRCPAVA